MTTPLKPCPHCGSTDTKVSDSPADSFVECDQCGLCGPMHYLDVAAIAAWNAMPRPSDVAALKARAEAAEAERDRLAARVAELEAAASEAHT